MKLCRIKGVVTDGLEVYKEPLEERIPHQVCLAHMRKNFRRRLLSIKEGALDIKEKLGKQA
jgi:hypothetical protein